jgi:SWI/SNF-related matrix-associated actin-dependent regulator of chromatin subfamily A protein 2/4
VQPDHHIVITKVNEVGICILGFALFCQSPLLNSSGWMGIQSELLRWLPSVSCIFYVGGKEQRAKIYAQEVCAMKFNVMVTTYEFIMRDRAKLSKVEWKYMIIDEAQRMKDRESRLARDLDRFSCQRRLLLTGTPLQNDLHELWSLLNLLLPEVFDNSKAFHEWFSTPFQKEAVQAEEDDWLETEKKVIVIHRLHQILEPFMLRRRVEDVEGSLPPKVSVVLKCKMSAFQAAIYDWIKVTGTIRLDPEDEAQRVAGNSKRQARAFAPLQNKCMELRKVCNHPCLNYPPRGHLLNDNVVRMCGKLWILDRILVKLHRTGHRVLLFSTMTRLLDILEDYLQWRRLMYRRIDGTTSLDGREAAIVEFNRPGSEVFIFLLSIRAAGRGLNLQSADTVVIYDPDPNPKNEEQAVARAHRIGQKREVRVIYMEAVVERVPSFEKEDELRSGGNLDEDGDEMVSIFYESCGYLIHLETLGDGTKACRICDLMEIA